MNFGEALEALKEGKKVRNLLWSDDTVCLWLKPKAVIKSEWCKDPFLKTICDTQRGECQAKGTICSLNTWGCIVSGWVPSQADMLEGDWQVIDDDTVFRNVVNRNI